jgi:phosphoglycerol transferase MdoB-like AlkP superfamily enzyme
LRKRRSWHPAGECEGEIILQRFMWWVLLILSYTSLFWQLAFSFICYNLVSLGLQLYFIYTNIAYYIWMKTVTQRVWRKMLALPHLCLKIST